MSDTRDFQGWIGREQVTNDVAAPAQLLGLAALLDRLPFEAVLPPLGHWLYFLPRARQSQLGADGHPELGDFLPPLPHARRMWAGGRVAFRHPIAIGATMTRRSRIAAIASKNGSSGPMTFVTLHHDIIVSGRIAVREEQDIVYRAAETAVPVATSRLEHEHAEAAAIGEVAEQARSLLLDSRALFRFSALTFNAHRIHYDGDYVRNVEGYPGLVVQGPFLAMHLIHFVHDAFQDIKASTFAFRAIRPAFEGQPLMLLGSRSQNGLDLWVRNHDGHRTMVAELIRLRTQ